MIGITLNVKGRVVFMASAYIKDADQAYYDNKLGYQSFHSLI